MAAQAEALARRKLVMKEVIGQVAKSPETGSGGPQTIGARELSARANADHLRILDKLDTPEIKTLGNRRSEAMRKGPYGKDSPKVNFVYS